MVKERIPEDSNYEIKGDKYHAQILIRIKPCSKGIDEAKKIIENSGVSITKTTCLSSGWVLLELETRDMRDIGLKLTEYGFFIHGINATN